MNIISTLEQNNKFPNSQQRLVGGLKPQIILLLFSNFIVVLTKRELLLQACEKVIFKITYCACPKLAVSYRRLVKAATPASVTNTAATSCCLHAMSKLELHFGALRCDWEYLCIYVCIYFFLFSIFCVLYFFMYAFF